MSKVCIECGEPLPPSVTKLYHERLFKKTKILKLVQCERCDEVCDKYLEYEGTLLLLDVGSNRLTTLDGLEHLPCLATLLASSNAKITEGRIRADQREIKRRNDEKEDNAKVAQLVECLNVEENNEEERKEGDKKKDAYSEVYGKTLN